MKTATASLAVLFCLIAAHNASAQIGIRVGNVGVTVRGNSTGGYDLRGSRSVSPGRPVSPRINAPLVQPRQRGYSPVNSANQPGKGPWFMGRWTLSSNDSRSGAYNGAVLTLGQNGFSLINTLGQRENGNWVRRFNGNGNSTFDFGLKSSFRGETYFRGRWIVPQQQFVLVGTATGVRYTLTRQ